MTDMLLLGLTSFFAGMLTMLTPCVLPLMPILLLSAWQEHRWGPFGLVLGLSTTFTLVGLTLAASGSVFGIDPQAFKTLFTSFMLGFSIILLVPWSQNSFNRLVAPLTRHLQTFTHSLPLTGWWGQFALGVLLGGAWIPCTGPTLGVAIALAAQAQAEAPLSLFKPLLIMMSYSLGVGLPLIGLSYLSRHFLSKRRSSLLETGKRGRQALGLVLFTVALSLLMGWEQPIAAWLTAHMPQGLISFLTRY